MFDDFDFDDPYFWRSWPRAPKKVKGGIKAQSKKFGNQWWAAQWLEAIEKFGPTRRVARGRSYARKGQVLDLHFTPGSISATVQGTSASPYRVEILLEIVPVHIRERILKELRSKPIYIATFLNGEVPEEVDRVFQKHDISLFPTKAEGRGAICSCPDVSNPCKHIAAVYYLISLELERDPFLLLYLRGIGREELVPGEPQATFDFSPPSLQTAMNQPLPMDPQQFWKSPRLQEIPVTLPPAHKGKPPLLQRLGPFPFWRGDANLMEILDRIYASATENKPSL